MKDLVLQPEVLDRLEQETGPEFLMATLELFLFELTSQEAAVAEISISRDIEKLLTLVHTLKSSAATLGAMPLSQTAARSEKTCQEGACPDSAELAKLAQQIGQAREAVASLLAQSGERV